MNIRYDIRILHKHNDYKRYDISMLNFTLYIVSI